MSVNRSADINVIDLVEHLKQFGVADYGIFIAMLGISSAIGLYFGLQDKRNNQRTNRQHESIENDYLVGGRKMKVIPIAISLAATLLSGISLLGLSSEIYVHGTQFVFIIFSLVISATGIHYLFIPVFLDLQLTSSYEYLETRFDRKIRYLGAFTFILTNIFVLPILIYITALGFNQVSGINIYIITPITCLVCIFYTTFGGMKAVVWTDVIQTIIMYSTMILIVVKGTLEVGGINTVWHRNYESDRIEFPDFTFDLTVRHSLPAIIIGGTIQVTQGMSVSQLFVQRYASLPNKQAAQKALWLFTMAIIFLFILCFYSGLLIYATYYDCDPITTKLAQTRDQLLPVLVMDVLKNVPGIAGLFVAGIFSATLSTLSTTLNSFAAVVLEDFIKPSTTKPLSRSTINIIMRSVVVITGLICVGLVFIVEKFSSLLQLKYTVTSCTSGPIYGIFLIGILLPWINSNSALFGAVVSLIIMIWITFKSQMAILSNEIVFESKPMATYGCTYNYTTIMRKPIAKLTEVAPQIYHISYLWNGLLGTVITIIVAGLASFAFGRQNPHNVNPVLLAPFVRKYFQSENHVSVEMVTTKKDHVTNTNSITETTHEFSLLPSNT